MIRGVFRRGAFALASSALVGSVITACAGRPELPGGPSDGVRGGCSALGKSACKESDGLLSAVSAFSNVDHDFLLDPTGSYAPGRGVTRHAGGYKLTTQACAEPKAGQSSVDQATIDYSYVGLAVDDMVVGADAELVPLISAGAESQVHKVKLVAVAFVRDKDPQFFSPSGAVTYEEDRCACGGATDFIGSVKVGGMLAYEILVRSGEVHGKALEFVKAKLRAEDTTLKQTVVGGLEVSGLEEMMEKGARSKPLKFVVKNPVPVAYALYPLSDVCRFSLPEPEVSPPKLDFGDVPYGKEATRYVHVVNRSPLELRALVQGNTFAVPGLGTTEIPLVFKPEGSEVACEAMRREEALVFHPRDEAPVTPKSHSMRVETSVRSGAGEVLKVENVDSGESHRQDWEMAKRDVACPRDYLADTCTVAKEDGCGESGVHVEAVAEGGVCHFAAKAKASFLPTLKSRYCRYQATAKCRLKCP